jgi:septum formation topological specificity factor MinE
MNSHVKDKVKNLVAYDKYDMPILTFKNLKSEVYDIATKFVTIKNNEINMSVKVLKSGEYLVEINFLADKLALGSSDM